MAIRKLEKKEWEPFFDALSAQSRAQSVEIEVLSPALGAQFEGRSIPLVGLSYDPRDDALDVVSKELDHRISAPAEIYIDETSLGLQSLEVVTADGVKQILRFAPVLQLSAAIR